MFSVQPLRAGPHSIPRIWPRQDVLFAAPSQHFCDPCAAPRQHPQRHDGIPGPSIPPARLFHPV